MLKILQARLQQYENWELPAVQAGFWRGSGTRGQIANVCWLMEKAREFQENTYFCFITLKLLTVWIRTNCGNFLKRWEYQTTWPVSSETCTQVKKQQLELDREEVIGSKLRKENNRGAYCHSAYLTSVQSTSCEMLGWMNHKVESRLPGEVSTTSDMQIIPL